MASDYEEEEGSLSGQHRAPNSLGPRAPLPGEISSVPWFHGDGNDAHDARHWVDTLSEYAMMWNWAEGALVRVARTRLVGPAHHWISSMPRDVSWAEFEREFLGRFGERIEAAMQRLSMCKQEREESVHAYADRFRRDMHLAGRLEDAALRYQFIAGLQRDLRHEVQRQHASIRTMADVVNEAKHWEACFEEEWRDPNARGNSGSYVPPHRREYQQPPRDPWRLNQQYQQQRKDQRTRGPEDQRKVEWWFKLQQKDTTSFSRQALEASWPSHRNYTSWQKRFNKLRAELGMQEETLQARVREGHLPSFRAYVRWSIYERDRAVQEEGARNKSTLATYMQHYNDDINYFKPQPYLCTGPLSKGMELIMQLRAGILPLNAMTAKFGRQSASRQSARRECCKSCDLGPELGGEVESPEHFLFDCPVYQAQRQKLWEKLTSDPDVAAKCQILDGKSDEEKLHSMLNEEFWGVDVDEESGLVYGPFKHAFKCIAKYVAAAWKIRNAYAHPSDVA